MPDYRGCQKNVPIEDLFSAATPYAAILFSEHYYDKRYKYERKRYCRYKEKIMEAKVLLVDDEKDFLESMSERMRLRGMDVTTASSAKEALAFIESDVFDAVILDFQLPEMDGMAVLKKIKTRHPEAQIILLTGHASLERGVEAIKIGASDYLEKPADMEALSKKIKEAKTEKMLIVQKQQLDSVLDTIKKYGI